jgi:1-acyl-sn-glycerol-3-phosphate acyltransferase
MKIIQGAFGALYHIWYYFLMVFVIVAISPFIYFTSLKEDSYPKFFRWSRIWAKLVLMGMGIKIKKQGSLALDANKTYIICANHSSEIDIMMCLVLVPNCFVFIGKKELGNLPLFGYFYKRTNILVDRKSLSSKRDVLAKAAKKIKQGTGVCIYPEGGIPDPAIQLAPFKMGAFKLAMDTQTDILPLSFPDNKRRYPDSWWGGSPGQVRAVIHKPILIKDLEMNDIHRLKDMCYEQILSGLN